MGGTKNNLRKRETNENSAIEAVATALTSSGVAAASGAGGSITVATITSTVPASGIAGWLGLTTTTTTVIAVPIVGVIAAAALIGYGVCKGIERAQQEAEGS